MYENYILDDREEEELIGSPEEITGDLDEEDTHNVIDDYEVLDVIDVVDDGVFINCKLNIFFLNSFVKR